MALSVGTIKTHWEENCPLHLRESKGHSKSITLYSPNSSQLSGIKKAWGGAGKVGAGSGDKPSSLVFFRGVFSPRPESQLLTLHTKGLALSTHQHACGSMDSQTEMWRDGKAKINYLRAGPLSTMTLATSDRQRFCPSKQSSSHLVLYERCVF